MKLANTRLLVKDFKTSFLFYRDVMGLVPTFGGEDDVYADLDTGGALLALFQTEMMEAAVGADTTLIDGRDKAVLVFEVVDVDKSVRDLQAKGVTFLTQPQDRPDWGIRTAHLRDLEGNLIEIYSPLAR